MPIVYHVAKDGTRYPVYSGADVLTQVRSFYLSHAGTYGYTPHQMALLLSGHPQPFSFKLKQRIALAEKGNCCRFDPSAVKVGQTVPSMAVPPSRIGHTPLYRGLVHGDAVTGTIPPTVAAGTGTVLTSGAVVRPVPPPNPHAPLWFALVVAFALVLGLGVYALVRHFQSLAPRESITVAAPAPAKD